MLNFRNFRKFPASCVIGSGCEQSETGDVTQLTYHWETIDENVHMIIQLETQLQITIIYTSTVFTFDEINEDTVVQVTGSF